MNTQAHRTLGAMVKQTGPLAAVRKNDLRFGDRVVVTTCNSTYSIHVLKNGQYAISGGWVNKEGLSPTENQHQWLYLGWIGHPDGHRGCLWTAPGVWQSSRDHQDTPLQRSSLP